MKHYFSGLGNGAHLPRCWNSTSSLRGAWPLLLAVALAIGLTSCALTVAPAATDPPGKPATSPSIVNVSPNQGVVGTGVTIAGANFGATQGTSTVTFGGGVKATPTSWSGTSIVAPVPAGAVTGNVVVTVGGQASNGANFTVITGQTA